jgi:hypothetical protein
MNQPKDICCLRGKGFKVNIKIRLNQITAFADHKKKLFARSPALTSSLNKNIARK